MTELMNLKEYNDNVYNAFISDCKSGMACPDCDKELINIGVRSVVAVTHQGQLLEEQIKCFDCNWKGVRYDAEYY